MTFPAEMRIGSLEILAGLAVFGAVILFGLALWLMPPEVYSPVVVGGAAVLISWSR